MIRRTKLPIRPDDLQKRVLNPLLGLLTEIPVQPVGGNKGFLENFRLQISRYVKTTILGKSPEGFIDHLNTCFDDL